MSNNTRNTMGEQIAMPPHLLNNCHQIHFSLVEKKVAGLMGR
jgi:hypothetical protein